MLPSLLEALCFFISLRLLGAINCRVCANGCRSKYVSLHFCKRTKAKYFVPFTNLSRTSQICVWRSGIKKGPYRPERSEAVFVHAY
jgi:hypothetical protein